MVPLGDDGSRSHAFGVLGNLAFESNHEHAQKLTKKFLDWCVSTDETTTKFVSVHWAIRILPKLPSLPNFYVKNSNNKCTLHRSFACFLHLLDMKETAEKFVKIEPKHYTIGNCVKGFFENKTGLCCVLKIEARKEKELRFNPVQNP